MPSNTMQESSPQIRCDDLIDENISPGGLLRLLQVNV